MGTSPTGEDERIANLDHGEQLRFRLPGQLHKCDYTGVEFGIGTQPWEPGHQTRNADRRNMFSSAPNASCSRIRIDRFLRFPSEVGGVDARP
jgi:hypothetical protein